MSDPVQEATQGAIEQGKRNAAAIPLVKKHCLHAEVELSPHHGVSELESLGIPVSARIMRCPFGPQGGPVGMDLLENALGFYERNCIDCEHREARGVPNLKTVAEQLRDEKRQEGEARDREQERAASERRGRAEMRAKRVACEPPPTRHLIQLLDGLDADASAQYSEEFVDLCRLQPQLCTEVAGEVLLDAAESITSEALFEGLDHLERASRIPPDRLLQAALDVLSRAALSRAAGVVVRLQNGLAPGQLRPAIPAIIRLAGPVREFVLEPEGDIEPLRLVARNELPALLDTLIADIGSSERYRLRTGARAAQRLIEAEPGAASALIGPLIDALSLPGALGHYLGDPRETLMPALRAAFRAQPAASAELIERRAQALDPAVRSALFHVFSGVVGAGRDREIDPQAAEVAIEVAFRRLAGDWGEDVEAEAAEMISSAARYQPELMVERVDQLFGALLRLTASPIAESSTLDLPPAHDNAVLAAMETHGRAMRRQATIRGLREAIGSLVPHAPDAIAENVFAVAEAPEPVTDEGKDLRDQAVRLLGDLGKRPDLVSKVLPRLYSALLHADARVRATAVEGWREIAAPRNRDLPADLGELLPRLLADEYVVVHRAAIRAIRFGLPVPEAQLEAVVSLLMQWAEIYAQREPDVLDDLIDAAWGLSRRLAASSADLVREHCLRHAAHLNFYDKNNLLERRAGQMRHLPSFPARLLEVLADPHLDANDYGGDMLLRELRDQPSAVLLSYSDPIAAAARAHLPYNIWRAYRFIEVLQRIGLWGDAAALADEILSTVPDTQERALQRFGFLAIVRATHAEDAIASNDPGGALATLRRAAEADQEHARLAEEHKMPWEFEG